MVSALDYRSSVADSSPDRGHCVVFFGKTLYSHIASLHPGVFNAGGNPVMDKHPTRGGGGRNTSGRFVLRKPEI